MSRRKLTDWYPPDVAPVREGAYGVRAESGQRWYRWIDLDGAQHVGDPSPKRAAEFRHSLRVAPLPWRGLAEDPQGGKDRELRGCPRGALPDRRATYRSTE